MTTLPDHPALILSITAAVVYLWLAIINPFLFAGAHSLAIDYPRPSTMDVEPAPHGTK
jgi:hypothetical protein